MKTLDTNFLQKLITRKFSFALLVELEFSTTCRYTNHDIPISFNGNMFTTTNFTLNGINTTSNMAVDQITLVFADADTNLSAIVLQGDIISLPVTLWLTVLDDDTRRPTGDPDLELFTGMLSTWKLKEDKVSFTVVNNMIHWNKRSLRKAQANCRWEFKGTECTYSGAETSCNKSWERCSALSNSLNYGGFRFLPAMSEQIVWWGRSPV